MRTCAQQGHACADWVHWSALLPRAPPPRKPDLKLARDYPMGLRMEQQNASSLFDIIVWSGAALSVLGLCVLVYCIVRVSRAKRAGLDDAAMRDELKKVVPLNLGALFISAIGLMMVIVGIFLG